MGSGSNLLVADAGFRGLVLKLDGALAHDRARRRPPALRRRRPPAAGLGARGARGPHRARVRREHPGHRRRRGEDERQRLRRRAGKVLEWVDVATPGGSRAARRPTSSASPTGARTSARARSSRAPRSRSSRPTRPRSRPRSPTCATQRKAAQPSGHQDLRLHLQEPRRPARRGPHAPGCCSRRPAAAACRWAARASRESTRTSWRTWGEATTADVLALMAEGRRRVRERFGIELEAEVQLLGDVERGQAEAAAMSGCRCSARSRTLPRAALAASRCACAAG